jgi:predicted nucleic acid-binding protein
MPAARVFVDTNIVFYSRDVAADPRIAIASRWVASLQQAGALVLNLQVLNELANVLLRKRPGLGPAAIHRAVDELLAFGAEPISLDTILAARQIAASTNYSWWDCILLAAALELGCSHFLSEDLEDGRRIGAMSILNPFAHAPDEILGRR